MLPQRWAEFVVAGMGPGTIRSTGQRIQQIRARYFIAEVWPALAGIGASPHPLGPDQRYRPAERRGVTQADPAAPVPDRQDTAGQASCDGPVGFDVDQQVATGIGGGDHVHAVGAEQYVGQRTLATARAESSMGHVRVSYELRCLVATN